MINQDFARRFAADWIAAWNSHDLDRILSLYDNDFEMRSPTIIRIAGEPSGVLRGKTLVRAYWAKALAQYPALRFEPLATLLGVNSLILYYRGANERVAADAFEFGANGRVVSSRAYYGV